RPVIVTVAVGTEGVAGTACSSPELIVSSSARVTGACGCAAVSLAMRPAATTALSSACAHEVAGLAAASDDHARSVTSMQTCGRKRLRIPLPIGGRPEGFNACEWPSKYTRDLCTRRGQP